MWDNFRSFKVSFKKKNGPESNYYVRQDVSCSNCSIKKCFLLFRASTFVDRLDVLYVCVCFFLWQVGSAEAWSFKNTALAAQTFILSCAAHGLATAPMEGFDARR